MTPDPIREVVNAIDDLAAIRAQDLSPECENVPQERIEAARSRLDKALRAAIGTRELKPPVGDTVITVLPVTDIKFYGISTFAFADGTTLKVKHKYDSPEEEKAAESKVSP